jgi:hypothetical protein
LIPQQGSLNLPDGPIQQSGTRIPYLNVKLVRLEGRTRAYAMQPRSCAYWRRLKEVHVLGKDIAGKFGSVSSVMLVEVNPH